MASYESAIPYIKKAEGGHSRAVTDTASKSPSPYTYKGQTGWHTNKGITWETFQSLAPKAGYEVSENNFINMPDSVWLSIYKEGYWNPMFGNNYTSQAIANAVVDFAWAGGVGGARKGLIKHLKNNGITADGSQTISEGLNKLVKTKGEKKAFSDLIDYRKSWFQSLGQPANERGWLNRMDELRKQGEALLGDGAKFVKKNMLGVTLIMVGVTGIAISILIKK